MVRLKNGGRRSLKIFMKAIKIVTRKIKNAIRNNKSIVLIGPTDSGKSYFASKILLPALKKVYSVKYFSNGDLIKKSDNYDVVIFDEVELLLDQKRLEKQGEQYSSKYLKKIAK